uniref:Uncharacterized protein n=1 Tax=Mycena chlorophos TaxID=658473 RepID=A0ABQ0LPN7_MYCCL|nr:predicted protein [Mycena chlorophos]
MNTPTLPARIAEKQPRRASTKRSSTAANRPVPGGSIARLICTGTPETLKKTSSSWKHHSLVRRLTNIGRGSP